MYFEKVQDRFKSTPPSESSFVLKEQRKNGWIVES